MKNDKILALLLILLAITPLIELTNGDLVRNIIVFGTFTQVYKGIVILLTFILLKKKEKAYYLLALAVGLALSFLHTLNSPLSTNSLFMADVLFVIKITYIIPLSFIAVNLSERYIFWSSFFAWVVITANILLGIIGIGQTQYALGYGFKGFFFSGNEMALVLMVTSAVVLFFLYRDKKIPLALTFSAILLFLGPLQGMKSLIFGLPLIAIIVPVLQYSGSIQQRFSRISKKSLLSYLLGVCLLLISAVTLLYTISPQFFVRFKEISARSGIVGAILSERDKYLSKGLIMYSKDYTLVDKVAGKGVIQAQQGMVKYLNRLKTIEMDPFDLLFTFGIVTLVYYGVWLLYIKSLFRRNDSATNFTLFLNILLLLLSVITGHVVYSTFLITYWAMANALAKRTDQRDIFFLGSTSMGGISTYMKETVKNAPELKITILPTHVDGGLAKTFFAFTVSYIVLAWKLLACTIRGSKAIVQLHMATSGSFVRKVSILHTLSWFTDKTYLHLHSGESANFFKKISHSILGRLHLSSIFLVPDGVFVVSKNLFNEIISVLEQHHIAFVKNNWHVLANAIAVPSPLPHPRKFSIGNKLHILTVSRLSSVKNLTLVPKIASILKKHEVNFSITIIGDGPDREQIQQAIIAEDVEDCVKLGGQIPHEKIGGYYKDAHVFLLPSTYESFGIVVLEAYLYGLPAITSDVGGLRDIVLDDITGFRCNPTDHEEFAEVLELLAHDSEKLAFLSQNAQKLVKEYDYKKHIKSLSTFYN